MAQSYIIMTRTRSTSKDNAVAEYRSEIRATDVANRLYRKKRLDRAVVVTIDPDDRKWKIVFKVERNCKHTSIQATIEGNKIHDRCCLCGDLIPRATEVTEADVQEIEKEEVMV